jgi:hypothetical protein
LVEREAAEYIAKQKARNDNIAAMCKPFADLYKNDPSAERALKELGSELGNEPFHRHDKVQLLPSNNARPFLLSGPVKMDFVRPPYAWATLGGNYSSAVMDTEHGIISITGDSGSVGGAMGGPVYAEASVGFTWNTSPGSVFRFCPQLQYEWEYNDGAYGAFSSASTSGIIRILLTQNNLSGWVDLPLFTDSGSTAHGGSSSQQGVIAGGVNDFGAAIVSDDIGPWNVAIKVIVQCDHSTGAGVARATGYAKATVSSVNIYFATL